MRGTLAQLRSWAREGLHGVKWGALIVRCSDKLQLLLQEVSLSEKGLGMHFLMHPGVLQCCHYYSAASAQRQLRPSCTPTSSSLWQYHCTTAMPRTVCTGLAGSCGCTALPTTSLMHVRIGRCNHPCLAVPVVAQAPYSVADVVWGATDCVYDNMVARGRLEPHLPPGAAEAELRAAKAAAAAAVPDAVVPVLLELGLK